MSSSGGGTRRPTDARGGARAGEAEQRGHRPGVPRGQSGFRLGASGRDQPCRGEGSGVLAAWAERTNPQSIKPQHLWRFFAMVQGLSAEGPEWPERGVHEVSETEMDGEGVRPLMASRAAARCSVFVLRPEGSRSMNLSEKGKQ